jgi:hypothetical protein
MVASSLVKAQTNLVVRSSGDCPSARVVSEALWTARPDREWPPLAANIEVVENRIRVSLGEDQAVWREVPAPADCADRANRAALVIAAWSGELPAQTTSAPSLSVAVPAPLPVQAVVAKHSATVFELGFSGFYSMVGGSVPGGRIELAWLRREGWWGLRAGASYQATKSLYVDIGRTQYDRTLLGAALVLQWNRPRYFLSSDWGLVGALVRVHGDGYTENESASGLNVALDAEGRVGLRLRAFRIWADAVLYRWLGKETIRVDPMSTGLSSTATLPRWDVHLGLGAGVMFD